VASEHEEDDPRGDDSDEGAAPVRRFAAISPAKLAAGESEGGMIDLMAVVDEVKTTAGSHGQQESAAMRDEAPIVEGSRGRLQVFELALAGRHGAGTEAILPIADAADPLATAKDRGLLPGASAEYRASSRSRACDDVLAEAAQEPKRADAATDENDAPLSAGRFVLLGAAVIAMNRASQDSRSTKLALHDLMLLQQGDGDVDWDAPTEICGLGSRSKKP